MPRIPQRMTRLRAEPDALPEALATVSRPAGVCVPVHALVASAVLTLAVIFSYASSLDESLTWDEPVQLTAGAAFLETGGDSRLSPEHPPLPRTWAALALRAVPHAPFSPDVAGFASGDADEAARDWLGDRNDGHRVIRAPRAAMIPFHLALAVAVGLAARRLFGPDAGLLALTLTALEPAFLAHGHYVTNDVPTTLFALLSILTFSRWLERPGAARLAAAAAALAAASLSKQSWLLVVPALVLMAAVRVFRMRRDGRSLGPALGTASAGLAALLAAAALAVWAAFGFRFTPFRGEPTPSAPSRTDQIRSGLSPAGMDEAWEEVLRDAGGGPERGLVPASLRFARRFRLLPESYLYGFAYARHHAEGRRSYLADRVSQTGFRAYFPAALLLKTPVPTLLLLLGGLALLAFGRVRLSRDPLLATGLVGFAAVYAAVAIAGSLNIGLRHFFPVFPVLLVAASVPAALAESRAGRAIVVTAALWLAAIAASSFPSYLGYFNEIAGGWQNGHRWLVDSNLDWDQDLLRLRDWAGGHPDERLILLRSGKGPLPRGLAARRFPDPSDAPLAAATYVVSASHLVGAIQPLSRAEAWENDGLRRAYRSLWEDWAASGRLRAPASFENLRRARLVCGLRGRRPDDRIGTSLFVFRLSDAEIDELTRPGETFR